MDDGEGRTTMHSDEYHDRAVGSSGGRPRSAESPCRDGYHRQQEDWDGLGDRQGHLHGIGSRRYFPKSKVSDSRGYSLGYDFDDEGDGVFEDTQAKSWRDLEGSGRWSPTKRVLNSGPAIRLSQLDGHLSLSGQSSPSVRSPLHHHQRKGASFPGPPSHHSFRISQEQRRGMSLQHQRGSYVEISASVRDWALRTTRGQIDFYDPDLLGSVYNDGKENRSYVINNPVREARIRRRMERRRMEKLQSLYQTKVVHVMEDVFWTWRKYVRERQLKTIKSLTATCHFESMLVWKTFLKWRLALLQRKWENAFQFWRENLLGKVLSHWKRWVDRKVAKRVQVREDHIASMELRRRLRMLSKTIHRWHEIASERGRVRKLGNSLRKKTQSDLLRRSMRHWHGRSLENQKWYLAALHHNRSIARKSIRRWQVLMKRAGCREAVRVLLLRNSFKRWERFNRRAFHLDLLIGSFHKLTQTRKYKLAILGKGFHVWSGAFFQSRMTECVWQLHALVHAKRAQKERTRILTFNKHMKSVMSRLAMKRWKRYDLLLVQLQAMKAEHERIRKQQLWIKWRTRWVQTVHLRKLVATNQKQMLVQILRRWERYTRWNKWSLALAKTLNRLALRQSLYQWKAQTDQLERFRRFGFILNERASLRRTVQVWKYNLEFQQRVSVFRSLVMNRVMPRWFFRAWKENTAFQVKVKAFVWKVTKKIVLRKRFITWKWHVQLKMRIRDLVRRRFGKGKAFCFSQWRRHVAIKQHFARIEEAIRQKRVRALIRKWHCRTRISMALTNVGNHVAEFQCKRALDRWRAVVSQCNRQNRLQKQLDRLEMRNVIKVLENNRNRNKTFERALVALRKRKMSKAMQRWRGALFKVKILKTWQRFALAQSQTLINQDLQGLMAHRKLAHMIRVNHFFAWKQFMNASKLSRKSSCQRIWKVWSMGCAKTRLYERMGRHFHQRNLQQKHFVLWCNFIEFQQRERVAEALWEMNLKQKCWDTWCTFSENAYLAHAQARAEQREQQLGWFARIRQGSALEHKANNNNSFS